MIGSRTGAGLAEADLGRIDRLGRQGTFAAVVDDAAGKPGSYGFVMAEEFVSHRLIVKVVI